MNIQAITLWQPWASLIATGHKRFETRSWRPPDRTEFLAIHAGTKCEWSTLLNRHFRAALKIPENLSFSETRKAANLPLGAIVCVARFIEAIQTNGKPPRAGHGILEESFGDFSPGRYAWSLDVVLTCVPPIVCAGHQRIWNLPSDIRTALAESLAGVQR
jgi:hypothetical protein